MKMYKLAKNLLVLISRPKFLHVKCMSSVVKDNIDSDIHLPQDDSPNYIDNSLQSQDHLKRMIPLTVDEFKSLRSRKPFQPVDPHLLKVTILGEPNVGKSTLTNSLVKWKVCAVSKKVHTTRTRAAAILMEENKQIVFLDTPGFVTPEHSKKHSLEASFVMDPLRSVREANLIAVIVDVSDRWTNNRINHDILEVLEEFKDKTSILVLNKVDAMKSKDRLLSFVRILTEGIVGGRLEFKMEKEQNKELSLQEIFDKTNKRLLGEVEEVQASSEQLSTDNIEQKRGWPLFSRVFMVSALKNDGVDELREYLLSKTVPGEWIYHSAVVTDQHPHQIALMTVRENLLEYLPNEIPYKLDVKIRKWEMLPSGSPKIDIKITCENSRHKRFVIGPAGKHITSCVERSRRAMREAFRKDVVLNIAVV